MTIVMALRKALVWCHRCACVLLLVHVFSSPISPSLIFVSACTNYIISKGASADGSTQITYNSDGQSLYGFMRHYAAADHPIGTMRDIYDFTSGVYLGSIPEAPHTYNVVGNMNEHQLSIAETTFDGLPQLAQQPGAKIDYYSLMWIVLQRCRTAREAIKLMDELTTEYGYASTGESFSIGDPNETWIMDLIGTANYTTTGKGTVWVARRVPYGYVSGHANQARITTFPLDDPDGTLYHPDTISFARSLGLYPASAPDTDFSFSDVFDPVTPAGARQCELRVWEFFRQAMEEEEGNKFASDYLDYVRGENLTHRMPLWVRAKKRGITLNETMWYTRSHYRSTWFDQRSDVGAGSFHAELRTRPITWQYEGSTYVNERNVGYQGTFFHFVAQARSWLPNCIGGLIWFGVDDASHSPRIPMYASSIHVPETYAEGNGNTTTFVLRSAYWIFNVVANLAYSRYDLISPDVQRKIVEEETEGFKLVKLFDAQALELFDKQGEKTVAGFLTLFSVDMGNSMVDKWITFWMELFVRYRDGLIVSSGGPPLHPRDQPPPANARQVGYSQDWYKRIVDDTHDHYRLPNAASTSNSNSNSNADAQYRNLLQQRKLDLLGRK